MRFAFLPLIAIWIAGPVWGEAPVAVPSSSSATVKIPTVKADPEVTRQQRVDSLLGRLHSMRKTENTNAIEREITEIWDRNKSATAEVLLQESTVAMGGRDLDPAEKMLSQLLETYPKFAAGWAKRAYLYHLMGRPDAALLDVDHALELEPRDYTAYALKGVILVDLNKSDEAIAAFNQALVINPHLAAVKAGIKKIEKEQPRV